MLDSRVCFRVRPVPFGSFELTPLILTCFPSTVSGTGGFPCLRGERGSQFVDTARVICGAGSTKLSSVRPSVCPFRRVIRPPHAAAVGLLLWAGVNFDLGERFPRPRSQQRGSLRPRARRVAVLGMGAGGGRPSRWDPPNQSDESGGHLTSSQR